MLSHHAPPRRLLHNFGLDTPLSPKLWVYSKTKEARPVYKITSESAENGYFSKDPLGRTEEEIDGHLNERYEGPFNRLLPAFSSGLIEHFDRSLVTICANYLAGILLRSKPRREATKAQMTAFNAEFYRRMHDPLTLRRYAAKISLYTRQPVFLDDLLRLSEKYVRTNEQAEDVFFQSATTDFSQLPKYLQQAHWAICHSPDLDFIQSDVAVALISITPERGLRFGTGIGLPGSQWFYQSHVKQRSAHRQRSSRTEY